MPSPSALHLLPLALLLAVGCPTATPTPVDDDGVVADDDDDSVDDDDSADDDDSGDDETEWRDCDAPLVDDPPPDPADCNADGVTDADQLASGEAVDCDLNGVPDECEIIDDACVLYGSREFVEYDGAQAAAAARGGPTFDPPHPIFLGGRWDMNPDRDFRGDLDEIVLIDRALTALEVADLATPFLAR